MKESIWPINPGSRVPANVIALKPTRSAPSSLIEYLPGFQTIPVMRARRSVTGSILHWVLSRMPPGSWRITGLAFSCSACTAIDSGVHLSSALIGSASTKSWPTVTASTSCLLGSAALHAHSRILPAYQADASGNPRCVANATQGEGSVPRPARMIWAPCSSAALCGSGPIIPTIRVARSIKSSVAGAAVPSGRTLPARTCSFRKDFSCSE